MKKKYGIIGNPLSHSLSPFLHNYWFKKYNIDAEYSLFDIKENEISNIIKKIKKKEISGINVTLPYKQKVIQYLSKIINDAKSTNSVNTIYTDNEGNVVGDNTDVYGLQAGYFKEIFEENQSKQKVLIMGAGGVSPSVIHALIKSGISKIHLANRTNEKAIFLKKMFPIISIENWPEINTITQEFDVIINATSIGLKNKIEETGIIFKNFKSSLKFIDTIYNPVETNTIKYLKSKNIKTFNGLDMFIYQGQKSFYFWHKINPEIDNELIELLKDKIK